jgi:hypothetical protein
MVLSLILDPTFRRICEGFSWLAFGELIPCPALSVTICECGLSAVAGEFLLQSSLKERLMKKRSNLMRPMRSTGLIALLFFVFAGAAFALEEGEGYDENTELTITGTVREVVKERRGPVIVRVSHGEKVYNVITAPPWYLAGNDIMFQPGLEIEVTGSKFLGRDGGLYLIARKLKEMKTNRSIMLRDDSLRPLWRGRRHSRGNLSECPQTDESGTVRKG